MTQEVINVINWSALQFSQLKKKDLAEILQTL